MQHRTFLPIKKHKGSRSNIAWQTRVAKMRIRRLGGRRGQSPFSAWRGRKTGSEISSSRKVRNINNYALPQTFIFILLLYCKWISIQLQIACHETVITNKKELGKWVIK